MLSETRKEQSFIFRVLISRDLTLNISIKQPKVVGFSWLRVTCYGAVPYFIWEIILEEDREFRESEDWVPERAWNPLKTRITILPQGGTQSPDRWDTEHPASIQIKRMTGEQRGFSTPWAKAWSSWLYSWPQIPSNHPQCPLGGLNTLFNEKFLYGSCWLQSSP